MQALHESAKQQKRREAEENGEGNELYSAAISSMTDNSELELTEKMLKDPFYCHANYKGFKTHPDYPNSFFALFCQPGDKKVVTVGPFSNRGSGSFETRGQILINYLAGRTIDGTEGGYEYTSLEDLLKHIAKKYTGSRYDNFLYSGVTSEFHAGLPYMEKIQERSLPERWIVFAKLMKTRVGRETLGCQIEKLLPLFDLVEHPTKEELSAIKRLAPKDYPAIERLITKYCEEPTPAVPA